MTAPAGPRRRATRPARAAALLAAALGLAACTIHTSGHGEVSDYAPTLGPSNVLLPGKPSATPAATCPPSYLPPDPQRPRVSLNFRIAPSLTTVTGTEHIAFTPDKAITELVFRLTPNTAPSVAEGNQIVVRSATADHGGGRYVFSRANAAPNTQGGLLRIPFAAPVAAGTTVHAALTFTVTLGEESFGRFGRTGGFAWFASAHPLLAWERGYGWHTEDMIDFPAESATSEAMQTSLTVTAPAADTVIMSGDPATPTRSGTTRTWHASLAAARDVSVAVGPFAVADVKVGAVRLRLGAPDDTLRDDLVPEFRRAITALAARFGPFPFPSLSVARLPASGGGIEYPGAILMLDGSRLVAVHETAHQWFYAMVGDSQAQHPWLDEAFAQYAEQLVDGTPEDPAALALPGRVGSSTESYGADERGYYATTYDKGAAALEAARTAAGPAKFDAALRCYVAANAWRIAKPADLQKALGKLPAAVAVLRKAGALP
ncbi:M1 family aminopeptidase [uncultured Jatrophihabitans sp.]|uniref:M1 family aminopeptidase n=1 Tax=uncultured Jatrophihabitans sp. TaxID=1610747 RepID=UPI0035C973C3